MRLDLRLVVIYIAVVFCALFCSACSDDVRDVNLCRDSLGAETWLEVEKNETIKICIDSKVRVWDNAPNTEVLNDSCLKYRVPTLVGVHSINVKFLDSDSSHKINLAIGMKYLDFKNEEVLLGYNTGLAGFRVTTKTETFITKEENPERVLSISGSYLVDKYPVTNCEIIQTMWDNIPQNPTELDTTRNNHTKDWIFRKNSSTHNEICTVHDSATNMVSLYQAMKYANARSFRDGLKPYYIFSETANKQVQIISKGQYIISYLDFTSHNTNLIQVSLDYTSDGYRLPFYDEWMMFARGGDKKYSAPWKNSNSFDEVSKFAKFDTKIEYNKTDYVGQLHPNGYGLYDILGMVDEHVLFEKINPFRYYKGSPSCFKGGNIHDNWKNINYGSTSPNYYSSNAGGFRLIRNIGNNAKWEEIKSETK